MARFIVIIIFVLMSVLTISGFILPAVGHGLGQSLEKQVNGYVMDVGYDAIDKIYTGDAIHFDFNLWKEDKIEMANFNHVWVRISPREEGIVFAGALYRPEFLLTTMNYTFQKAGQYDLTARFIDKDDKVLAEATFPLIVEESNSGFPWDTIIGVMLGIIIGAGASFLVMRKKHSIL
jgi:hypothetical protein